MAIKAKALTNFIAEFMYDVALDPETEAPEEQNQGDDLARWKLFIDGSSNQHGYGVGLVLQMPSREQMVYTICIEFKATNNEAEYQALLADLRVAAELEVQSLDVYSDS